VAGIAHEINTPTAYISNNLAYLKNILPAVRQLFDVYTPLRGLADPQNLTRIEQAEKNARLEYLWDDLNGITSESVEGIERIRKIVLSLRSFSHLDEAQLKTVDITEGLRSTLQIVRPMCRSGIQLIEDLQPIPAISCNPSELNQVFLNLLTNAVQSIEGQGQITMTSCVEAEWIIIKLQDTGVGMDDATLVRLGEPFFTTKPVGIGTGLGLSISYGIIEQHGGSIKYESKVGVGTTVSVRLPLAKLRTPLEILKSP